MPATSNRLLPTLARWLRRAALPVVAAATLAACGGGDRVEPFKPSRIYIYGDEFSYIEPYNSSSNPGLKYTVNAPASPQASNPPASFACGLNPLWVQWLVNDHYGKDLDVCPIGNEATPSATLKAQPGWTTQNVLNELNARWNAGGFTKGDLVVIFIGTNDVLGSSDVTAQGAALGQAVRRIAAAGANILVATVPVLGPDNAQSSRRVDFNNALRGTNGLGSIDGRRVALLQADAQIDSFFRDGNNSSWNARSCGNSVSAATGCYSGYEQTTGSSTTTTISGTNVNGSNLLWSFGVWFSIYGHELIGNLARSQVNDSWE